MFKRFFNNAWVKNVGGGALAILLLRLIDWLFINDFFWDYLKAIFQGSVALLDTPFSIKLYVLVLIGLLFFMASYGYKRFKRRIVFPETVTIEVPPDWKDSYTKDVFVGVQYRWEYLFDSSSKRYVIANIRAYCNDCNCQLVQDTCPNCGEHYFDSSWSHGNLKSAQEVEALVIHRIENKLYKNRQHAQNRERPL